jgi:hypothetical protein
VMPRMMARTRKALRDRNSKKRCIKRVLEEKRREGKFEQDHVAQTLK